MRCNSDISFRCISTMFLSSLTISDTFSSDDFAPTVHLKSVFGGVGQARFETMMCRSLCKVSQLTVPPGGTALSTSSCSWVLFTAICETGQFCRVRKKIKTFQILISEVRLTDVSIAAYFDLLKGCSNFLITLFFLNGCLSQGTGHHLLLALYTSRQRN